jgi:hypothetical protein
MMPAYEDAEILDSIIGRPWRYPWGHLLHALGMNQQAAQQTAMQIRGTPLSNDEWYMLDAEARRSHVYVAPEAIEKFKKELQLNDDYLTLVRTKHRKSSEEIDHALQSLLRVQESLVLACNSLKVSEADIRDIVRQTNEKVKIAALLVEAKKFIDDKYQPTEDELKAHFEKYKNVTSKPADSGDYGYEVPDAVKLDYIRVNMPPLVARQTVTDEEMYTYWSGHKNDFHKPTSQPASQAATKPAPPQSYATFTEARASVRDKMAKDKAKVEAMRIAREVISVLQQPWSTAPATQPDNLKQPPDSQTKPDVYDKIVALLDPKYPGVLRPGRTDWVDQNGINKIVDFSRMASMSGTQQEVRLMEAAFLAPGLDPHLDENANRNRLIRNLYETAPEPFANPNGDAVIIRTIAVRPKHPPASIDEIRARLLDDVRKVRAFGEAQNQAAAISDRATKAGGLDKLWASDPALKAKLGDDALKHPQPFPRQQIYDFHGSVEMYPSSVQGLGYGDSDLSKVAFDMAGAKTATQPAPMVVRIQAANQRFVVLEFIDLLPVTREEYDKARPQALHLLQSQHQVDLLTNWFDPEHIKERVGWKEAKPPESNKPSEPQKKT